VEVPFRVLPENEFRIADVAFISAERLQRLQGPYFEGAPDLVVEVLSPSNTASEILDRESLCLRNGARAFWQVDPQNRLIKVTTADGRSAIFGIGGEIPLEEFGGGKIAVSDVFADLK
jgi:Uma2 family endonuclease